jgi:hypothetical protein
MERENEVRSDLIDLGAARAETKGPVGQRKDDLLGQIGTGLTDD